MIEDLLKALANIPKNYEGRFATSPTGIFQYTAKSRYVFKCGYDTTSHTWYAYSEIESTRFMEDTRDGLGQTLDKVSNYYDRKSSNS